MKTRIQIALTVLVVLLISSQSYAQSLTQRTSPRGIQGMRPAGMGGAFSAMTGQDENAIFYNPAAINDYEKKVHMQFLLPSVEFSAKAIPFFSDDLPGLADDIDDAQTDSGKLAVFNDFVQENTGRYEEVGVRGSLVNFLHPLLTGSLFYENRSTLALLNPASTEVTVESLSQGGIQLGSAIGFFDHKLQVGVSPKFIVRHLISETVTQRDIVANDDFGDAFEYDNVGYGFGVDAGIKAKLPFNGVKVWEYLDPSFAVTLQDIGDTRFMGDEVGRQEQSLTAGFAIHPNFGKFRSALAVDFRDLDHSTDFITKLYAGYELMLPIGKVFRSASVRVGASQGYIAGGFGLDFKYFKINAATYGREIGQRTRQKESRMFGVQLAAGF